MENFVLIFACLLSGYAFRYWSVAPENAHEGINFFVLYLALPAVTLLYIPHIALEWLALLPLTASALVFGAAYLFFRLLQPLFGWSRATTGCLILTCGLGNTSFLGFPLVEAFYGAEGLKVAVLVDQGSFFMLATAGIATAVSYSEGNLRRRDILKKIVAYPQFPAFIVALFFLGEGVPVWAEAVLSKLAACLVPLALFSVGLQLKFDFKTTQKRLLATGLLYKLWLAPALLWVIFLLLGERSLTSAVTVVEAGMPPMITASILATQYKLNPPLAQLLVGVGILLSFANTWLWVQIL